MIYVVAINNKQYEVEVEQGQAGIVKTTEITQNFSSPANANPVPVPVSDQAPAESKAEGEPIKAPMPGVILDLKVSSGTKVRKGDVIVILEAMKMENEIVAPIDGVVVQIVAVKGSSVATGDVLAVIQ